MFYKENDFKNTEFGDVPVDWEAKRIADLFEVETGTTPSTRNTTYWEDGTVNWLTPADLSTVKGIYISDGKRKVTSKALKETNLTLIPKGSILLSTRAPVGYAAIVMQDSAFNQGCKGLVPKTDVKGTEEFYCYYIIKSKALLQNLSSGSTFKELAKDRLESFLVPLPTLSERNKIAEILTNIDVTIQKTDEVITETERLKKGLLDQLFTKGLTHKKFKKVEIRNRIYNLPEEWRISNLSETSTIKGRIGWQGLTTKEYLKDGEYLLVTGTDFENGRIAWDRCVYVSKERYMQDTNIQLKEGDILITKDGTIGKIAYVDKLPQQATLNSGIFVVRPVNSAYDPSYMFWIMQSKFFNVFMNILKAGSTISHLYQRDFVNFEFPIPPLEEQQKIVKILSTVDHKLDLERKEKRHLERVKSGLMDKLLSGRVRVK
jgi:type I restriction enzyme S subunit